MTAQITLKRSLRDDGDQTGQTFRSWSIQRDDALIYMCQTDVNGDACLAIRAADFQKFIDDIRSVCTFPGI